ncbi:pentapeptide repeat-containing protein [Actinomadura napierensis]|uniref:Pentapeptide repeat-containing protein n=1 Tax=Actinomadura napierensis TaxID=267854 RepID=A0ABN3AGT6_9ACTN
MGEVAPGGATGDPDPLGEEGRRREREEAAGLWPIRRALTVAGVTAVAGLVVLMTVALAVLGFPHLKHTSTLPLTQLLDVLKLVLGTVAGVGALFALVTAYRRQRLAEAAHDYAQRMDAIQQAHQERLSRNAEHDAAERRITELYNAAAEQLGSDKAPVRLTALYTLERLANDNERHRQTIVNIICAYLRMPWTPPPESLPTRPDPAIPDGQRRAAHRYRTKRAGHPTSPQPEGSDPYEERQVRLTAQEILQTHLSDHAGSAAWGILELDLSRATLIDFFFPGCTVGHASFTEASFLGFANFHGTTFTDQAGFVEASFHGYANFGKVTFSNGLFCRSASFEDLADFARASFPEGGNFHWTSFRSVEFNEVNGTIDLECATVVDRAGPVTLPPGWRIDPADTAAGRIVAAPTPSF